MAARSAAAAPDHNLPELLSLTYQFYEAQMSGDVPDWSRASRAQGGWRGASHLSDGRGPDGIGADLSGGWYDGGDHAKLHLPLAASASLLAYGALAWEGAYRAAGAWDGAVRSLAWAADYLARCHVRASDVPAENAFVAQVGDVGEEYSGYWGRPEQQPEGGARGGPGWRPVYLIDGASGEGADIVAEASAALAGTALLLQRPGAHADPAAARGLLVRARQLFAFAKTLNQTWTAPSDDNPYPSESFRDDLAWAAAWLCRADVEAGADVAGSAACAEAEALWGAAGAEPAAPELSWNHVALAAALLLRDVGAGGAALAARLDAHVGGVLGRWMDTRVRCGPGVEEGTVCYTPGGLAWYSPFGPNRYAANMALVALSAARGWAAPGHREGANTSDNVEPAERSRAAVCWARSQLGYLLGGNPANQSYVVGYRQHPSHRAPTQPHHRSSSCPTDPAMPCGWEALHAAAPNPSSLAGALVGGPGADDAYADVRADHNGNAVALDHNAGLAGALAGLLDVQLALGRAGCGWAGYCGEGGARACAPQAAPRQRPPQQQPAGGAAGQAGAAGACGWEAGGQCAAE